jgi:hypothetical protein
MLERCPYYEICDGEIRHARGNGEYYCLGTINWEYCTQFKGFALTGEMTFSKIKDNNAEIVNIARNMDDLFKITLENLLSYQNALENYLEAHPLSFQSEREENELQIIINSLKEKLETINEIIMKVRELLKL